MAETAEKRYAILIASSSYPKEPGLKDLRCPENDVEALDGVLRSPDFGGFAETFVFKNRPSHEVLERIETVLGEARRDDLVLIYFSGHGKLNPAGQLCLATANTKLRALGSTSIPVGSIKSYFDHSASRKKIFLLDCCYSGAVGKDFIRGGVDDQLQLVSRGQGTFIMTASTGIEVAVEKEGDEHGLFTKHLVAGIRSGEADKNEDGFVDMQELYEYVHEKVREDGAQEPMKWDLHVKGKLMIARSGREARKVWEQKARAILYGLAAQGQLPDDIVAEAMRVLSAKRRTALEEQYHALIEHLVAEKIRPADFIAQWVRVGFAGIDEPDIPEEENEDQEQVPLSAPDWGLKGESGGREGSMLSKFFVGSMLLLLIAGTALYFNGGSQENNQKSSDSSVADEQETVLTTAAVPVATTDQVIPKLDSSASSSLPEEEPEMTVVVVDYPKTKQKVAGTGQRGNASVQSVASQPEQGESFTDPTTGMELVYIPKGCFQMGSSPDEKDSDEGPVHKVCVDGFWMGKHEVTQGQWKEIMGDNPAYFKKGNNYPVEQVSWEDAQKFIIKLNQQSGKRYRLPTEAEWEYAAKAKSSYIYSGGNDLDAVAWYYDNSGNATHPVGQKKANAFGLYDMSGNVWEWCADWYGKDYYASSPTDNPTGPVSGGGRVLRGGSYFYPSVYCRSVYRLHRGPEFRLVNIGFRLVLPFQAAGS